MSLSEFEHDAWQILRGGINFLCYNRESSTATMGLMFVTKSRWRDSFVHFGD